MTNRTIERNEWKSFLASFSRQHHGWLVSIVRDGEHVVTDEPLEDTRMEDGTIAIVTSDRELRIENPQRIEVASAGPGDAAIGHVAITSPHETLTIRFREVISPELVDGIVP